MPIYGVIFFLTHNIYDFILGKLFIHISHARQVGSLCVTRADKYSSALGYVLIQAHTIHNKSPVDSAPPSGCRLNRTKQCLEAFQGAKGRVGEALPYFFLN